MPEKVHKKFDDGNESSERQSQQAAIKKVVREDQQPAKTNGVKRSRDGSPKASSQNGSLHGRADKKVNGNTKEDAVEDERPIKSKKVNGTHLNKTSAPASKAVSAGSTHGRANVTGRVPPPSNLAELRTRARQLQKDRERLPIWNAKNDIRYLLKHNDVLLLRGETGSGKTTQTPQFLHDQPWCQRQKVKITKDDGTSTESWVGGMVAITQPRRVAALTLARRVAAEMGSSMDKGVQAQVGYAVRFESFEPQGTKIKFVTEGTLLMELMSDPNLKKYSCVIIDEIHERSIDVDLVAGFLRRIVRGDLKGRGGIPLKVVIMSATFDLGGYEQFFAKPETVSEHKTGEAYGRILDPDLWDFFVDDSIESKTSRRSSASYSSWSGFGDDEAPGDAAEGLERLEQSQLSSVTNGTADTFDDEESSVMMKKSPKLHRVKTKAEYTERPDKEDLTAVKAKNGVAVTKVEGRTFPVQTSWLKEATNDYLQKMVQVIMDIHVKQPMPGDILCFLTGQEDIETLQTQLRSYADKILPPYPMMRVLPLYGSLPMDQQQAVFDPIREKTSRGIRKVVLATNIAETSVTVPGVRFVVDCGKNKRKMYRPKLDMDSLLPVPISKVSAIQRMGRAGREAAGICYRIYTEKAHAEFDEDEMPEILRCDALDTVLKMKARGVDDVFTFPLMDSPDADAITKALLRLTKMGALDSSGNITARGKTIAAFPLPAVFGQVVMTAALPANDVLLEAIDVISCLTSDSELFLQPKSEEEQEKVDDSRKDIIRREGDVLTMLTTIQRYHSENTDRKAWCRARLISLRSIQSAYKIRKQLQKHCLKLNLLSSLPPLDPHPFENTSQEKAETLVKVFLECFPSKVAVLCPDKSYRTIGQARHAIAIHPSSVLHGKKEEGILFLENVFTSKNYAKKVSRVQLDWVAEVASKGL